MCDQRSIKKTPYDPTPGTIDSKPANPSSYYKDYSLVSLYFSLSLKRNEMELYKVSQAIKFPQRSIL